MSALTDSHFHAHRGLGHVGENFDAGSAEMQALHGHVAIGHNRYSTSGKTNAFMEIQPFHQNWRLADLRWRITVI